MNSIKSVMGNQIDVINRIYIIIGKNIGLIKKFLLQRAQFECFAMFK